MADGLFITFEGGEGAGKSTQIERLRRWLEDRGISVCATREPGGSLGAERIRKLLVSGDADDWSPVTEALLMFAARADHLEKTIRPALRGGDVVLCDRFADSSMAYQGYAGALGFDVIERLQAIVVDETVPDLTILLDLPVEEGLRRANSGGEGRFENKGADYHAAVRKGFLEIARRSPERFAVVDASQRIDAVFDAIVGHVEPLLGGRA